MLSKELFSKLCSGDLVFSNPLLWYWFDGCLYKKWEQRSPRRGDHIRVQFGQILTAHHHGIYVSDKEVIHFSGADSADASMGANNRVICTSLDRFIACGKMTYKDVRTFRKVVRKNHRLPNIVFEN